MSYKIELIPSGISGARPSMFRCGLKFELGEPKILDLDKHELEVFKNDWRFKVSDSKDSGSTIEEIKASTRETILSADSVTAQETPIVEVAPVEDKTVAQTESVSSENETEEDVKELLKEHSRDELDIMAGELGLDGTFNNKTEVAQAIVDAR